MVAVVVCTLFCPFFQRKNRIECDDAARHAAMFWGTLARFPVGMFDSPLTGQGVLVVGEARDQCVIFPSPAASVGIPRTTADLFVVLPQSSA